jgi:hypothetical protein
VVVDDFFFVNWHLASTVSECVMADDDASNGINISIRLLHHDRMVLRLSLETKFFRFDNGTTQVDASFILYIYEGHHNRREIYGLYFLEGSAVDAAAIMLTFEFLRRIRYT